ncbi:MAG: DEAD/DEAH box helicase family protein [Caldicoprobacterales bacterium]|jgi:superfamily II DNA or RNA helicase|nr:DEAD/DEAH box helicase [Clostridiales bacterium]
MARKIISTGNVNRGSEELFIELFCDVFGPDKSQYIFVQYPFTDIYGNHRFIDFALESQDERIAIEVDGETYHNPTQISRDKYYDDLLKQNSLVYKGWKIYRWVYSQLKYQSEKVKDEMLTFFGELPMFKMIEDYLPSQKGKVIELKEHQQEALNSLRKMREEGQSIALLYHATGTGKTVTAVSDAKAVGQRTLFIGHTKELIEQAKKTFNNIWKEKQTGLYIAEQKEKDAYIVCGSVQSISKNIEDFNPEEFGYVIIDEAHHGTAETYRSILSYFKPQFTLGLTATPDRTDGEDLLEIFQNIAHKLDLKTAVEIGELVPVRCIRVKTNIDISDVRINGIKYNSQDLESKLFIPERNKVIVDTYLEFAKDKKTVIFCASVKHAKEIAHLLRENHINAQAVSGSMNNSKRKQILNEYESGNINVLCACDLLNEGWDSPNTQVLFMARPTMSKTLYTQQLGRGIRLAQGKEYLMVFDLIDNASLFNAPYSLHRLFNIREYRPGEYILAPDSKRKLDKDLVARGEKPSVYLDFPVDIRDFELVELFNWQEEVRGMISQMEFVRMVDVQSETIERYIRESKIIPDLEIPMGQNRTFKYFKEENVYDYAKKFGWELITPANMKDKFMDMVVRMDMSYSYKPVLLKGIFEHMDYKGRVKLEDLVDYFIDYYETRREKGLVVEKRKCLYLRDYTRKEVERNILSNPFKRFEDMNFMRKSSDLEYIELSRHIFKKLKAEEIEWIKKHCDRKLKEYFGE